MRQERYTEETAVEFVTEFVGASAEVNDEALSMREEILQNYFVRSWEDDYNAPEIANPYRNQGRWTADNAPRLKDPETHQVCETWKSQLTSMLFGDRERRYVQARVRGMADVRPAEIMTRLLRYNFGLEGHYRTFHEAVGTATQFGTGVVEVYHRYETFPGGLPVRSISYESGFEISNFVRMPDAVVFDDPCIIEIDREDFFPDPGETRTERMIGAAKRFRITADKAMDQVERGRWKRSAVMEAIDAAGEGKDTRDSAERAIRKAVGAIAQNAGTPGAFKPMCGFEYKGDVPWKPKDGVRRRVLTVLEGKLVRDIPWPYTDPRIPFHEIVICPQQGRFDGLSPAEVIRHDQDFADGMKNLIATAMVRRVHPPFVYDKMAQPDLAKLLAWMPDAPIGVTGSPDSVKTMPYDADVFGAGNFLGGLKQSMRESSGALGTVQGVGLGVDRASATEADRTFSAGMARPEMAARLIEEACLPPIGKAIIKIYQQMLYDSEDLAKRIGTDEYALAEMQDPDFDAEFIGSRLALSSSERLAAWDRLNAMLMIPGYPPELLGHYVAEVLKLPEAARIVATPEAGAEREIIRMMAGGKGQAGNGNGTVPASGPAGLLPAQTGGMSVPAA